MGTEETVYAGEARLKAADFIKNPMELRATLEARGAFRFVPFKSGLFPASNISAELAQLTEMDMGWLRDNAHTGNALYEDGRLDLAVPVAVAMIKILDANMDIIDGVVSGRDRSRRIPVRYFGETLARDHENRIQNDSVGYALWFTTKLLKAGVIVPTLGIQNIIAQTSRYLAAIEYWHDFDQGHWEEDDRIHTTSIGAVIAGLRGAQALFQKTGYHTDIEFTTLIDRGYETINMMHAYGLSSISKAEAQLFQAMKNPKLVGFSDPKVFHDILATFSLHRRRHDSAELFLIEPLGVITGEEARRIYSDNEKYLERFKGTGRYVGDSYWGGRDFDKEMSITERTRSAPGRLEQRNQKAAQIAQNKTEAQWTLFDPVKSEIAGNWYFDTYDPDCLDKHLKKLDRTLQLLTETESGELHWTENFYLADRRVGNTDLWESVWLPNPHSPLLWTQANALKMVRTFERVVPLAKLLGHL
ncbi:MAG TPA: glycoside hydrolase family 15 protein [Candidatus Saccharimonadales bacterium]|nr:glycoside hydrolase family 15 protein [Candidatus Saccharimonadales bacterium]